MDTITLYFFIIFNIPVFRVQSLQCLTPHYRPPLSLQKNCCNLCVWQTRWMKITQATKSKVLRMYARTSNHIKKIQPHNSINASDTPRSLRVQTKLAACTIKRIVTSCIVTSHALYLNGTRSITCMDRGSCLIAIKMAPSASFETKKLFNVGC